MAFPTFSGQQRLIEGPILKSCCIWKWLTVTGRGLQRIFLADREELLKSFDDEDDSNESCKILLCEPSDVAHKGTSISCNQDEKDQSYPDSNTESE